MNDIKYFLRPLTALDQAKLKDFPVPGQNQIKADFGQSFSFLDSYNAAKALSDGFTQKDPDAEEIDERTHKILMTLGFYGNQKPSPAVGTNAIVLDSSNAANALVSKSLPTPPKASTESKNIENSLTVMQETITLLEEGLEWLDEKSKEKMEETIALLKEGLAFL